MKKLLIGMVVAAILVLLGVVLFKHSGSNFRASVLAPEDTALFINIPDVPRTGFRWISTALAQIAAEPEMQAFLELPIKNFKAHPRVGETLEALNRLKPGNIFFAATPDGSGLMGFQFWGNRKDYDAAVAQLRQHLPDAAQEGSKKKYEGVEIFSTRHGDQTLHSAAIGRWGFLSNNSTKIQNAIDQVSGHANPASLESNAHFAKVLAQLPANPELMFFIETKSALDSFLEVGRSMGARPIPSQIDELKSAEAVGGTLKFDGRLQRDTIFVLRASQAESIPKLSHAAMAFTSNTTTAYGEFSLNFSAMPDFIKSLADAYPGLASTVSPLAEAASQLYGPECAMMVDWAGGNMIPNLLAAVSCKDSNNSAGFIAQLASRIPGAVQRRINGHSLYESSLGTSTLSLADGQEFLLIGLGSGTVEGSLNHSGSTLREMPEFKDALAAYESANEAFCFIDTRSVFTRFYDAFAPILRLSAAMMPNLKKKIDVSKLPKAETVAKHLPPIVLSQKRTVEGTLVESSGPVSMTQFLILSGAGAMLANQSLIGN